MEKDQLEKMSREYQELQIQLQSLAMQRAQFSEQKEEYAQAQKHLEASSGKVYEELGGLVVETTKEDAMKGLKDRLESAEMRLSIVEKQYNELSKKEQALRSTLSAELGKGQS